MSSDQGLTAERLDAFVADFGGLFAVRELEPDAASEISTISRSSMMSVNPSPHAAQRAGERNITVKDIQRAKAYGALSLAIHIQNVQDIDAAKAEVRDWGAKLKHKFPFLELGEPELRGAAEERVEMRLIGSEKAEPGVLKAFLRAEGYFFCDQRIQRIHFIEMRGTREIVVVEGKRRNSAVEVITVFTKDQRGRELETETAAHNFAHFVKLRCIDLYNDEVTKLIKQGDFPDKVERAIKTFEHSAQLPDGRWMLGSDFLSQWPPGRPSLHLASNFGRTLTVERLLKELLVDVNQQNKDQNTALHLAAYWAHTSTVELLLRSGADTSLRNKYGETALDSARAAQARWEEEPWFTGQRLDVFATCFSQAAPPSWQHIIEQLDTGHPPPAPSSSF